jgi:hypothetical protein
MNLIRNILVDQKFYESLEEVDKYLEGVGAEEGSMVQSLIFDKEVFETQAEATDWAVNHGFIAEKVDETNKPSLLQETLSSISLENTYRIRQLDPSEFMDSSMKTIEIRRGVKAVIGLLKRDTVQDMYLSLRNEDTIKLSVDIPHIIEIARVIKGNHRQFGEIEITKDILKSFVRNFNDSVVGIDLAIDFDHDRKEAAGWLKSVFLNFDETTLLGEVRWSPKGALALSDREFRYFSPEFTLNYVHPHTGEKHGATLLGGALVNRPFLKMDAIIGLNHKESEMEQISLKEHEEKTKALNDEIEALKLSTEESKKLVEEKDAEIKKLSDENISLNEKVEEFKKKEERKTFEDKCNKLFSENKINKAQLDAMLEGKDHFEVLSLSSDMNTKAKGENKENNETVSLSEKEKAFKDKYFPEQDDKDWK